MTEARKRRPKTLSFEPAAEDLLGKVGNASGYLSGLVQLRWRTWTEALETLRLGAWTRAEILAACDALNGTWLVGAMRAPEAIADELETAYDVDELAGKRIASRQRWRKQTRSLGKSAHIAAALVTVVEEYWLGNAACAAAIDKLGE